MRAVKVKADYPAHLSRSLLLLKTLFGLLYVGLPHGICLIVLGTAAGLVTIIAWFVVLFTGKYPQSLFSLMVASHNWLLRTASYLSLLRDEYPPFGLKSTYPVYSTVEYPAKLSRGLLLLRTFAGIFYVLIPHGICLSLRFLAHVAVTIAAWWAILFTGKIPASMFSFLSGTFRWYSNLFAYTFFLTDEYPPFHGKAEGVPVKANVAA